MSAKHWERHCCNVCLKIIGRLRFLFCFDFPSQNGVISVPSLKKDALCSFWLGCVVACMWLCLTVRLCWSSCEIWVGLPFCTCVKACTVCAYVCVYVWLLVLMTKLVGDIMNWKNHEVSHMMDWERLLKYNKNKNVLIIFIWVSWHILHIECSQHTLLGYWNLLVSLM